MSSEPSMAFSPLAILTVVTVPSIGAVNGSGGSISSWTEAIFSCCAEMSVLAFSIERLALPSSSSDAPATASFLYCSCLSSRSVSSEASEVCSCLRLSLRSLPSKVIKVWPFFTRSPSLTRTSAAVPLSFVFTLPVSVAITEPAPDTLTTISPFVTVAVLTGASAA
ncbi:hypothetical protein D3C76_1224450 [compost metagenome]